MAGHGSSSLSPRQIVALVLSGQKVIAIGDTRARQNIKEQIRPVLSSFITSRITYYPDGFSYGDGKLTLLPTDEHQLRGYRPDRIIILSPIDFDPTTKHPYAKVSYQD